MNTCYTFQIKEVFDTAGTQELLASSSIAIVPGGVIMLSILFLVFVSIASAQQPARSSRSDPKVVKIDAVFDRSYTSLGELKGASTLIVLGTVTEQKVSLDSHGVPSTLSTLIIEHTLKGASSVGQAVEIKQPGGVIQDGTQWAMENFPLLKIGTRYFMFLTSSPLPGVFYPVGAPQGVYVVNANRAVNSLTTEVAQMGVAVQNVPLDQFTRQVKAAPDLPIKP
jgi:hypothetical protein